MTEIEIETKLQALDARYRALGGGQLSVVMWPGRWAVSTGGGSPRFSATGDTCSDALEEADIALGFFERETANLARTLGVEAA